MYAPDEEWGQFSREPRQKRRYTGSYFNTSTYPARLAITERTFRRDWSGIASHLALRELFVLHVEETWAEDPEWWSERYFLGPIQE
jgi:hypothetical protein